MRIVLINCVCGIKSTGRICTDLAEKLEKEGHEVKIAYGREESVPERYEKYAVRIGNDLDVKLHAIRTRILDEHGFGSKRATAEFLKWADKYNPDMVWLHNIHGYYINVEMLFDWIRSRPKMKVQWTLHDCWAFTGHCAYFTMANCEKWKEQCEECPQKNKYPISNLKDNSRNNFLRKKRAFTGVKNMKLITPSKWLADLTRESFLNQYPVEVQYNTIDTDIFKPTQSDFREKYNLLDKKIVLGVASAWDERKGLEDFKELRELLNSEYVVVLVGLTKQQIAALPENIIGIAKTHNAKELAAIYTTADVFVNPSREETFGLTTVEAISCGTPVIVYKGTACEEIVEIYGGKAVEISVYEIYKEILELSR